MSLFYGYIQIRESARYFFGFPPGLHFRLRYPAGYPEFEFLWLVPAGNRRSRCVFATTCATRPSSGVLSGVVTKESGLSCQRGAFLGPGANDATVGLLAHRSALPAAFLGSGCPSGQIGRRLVAYSCGYSPGFAPEFPFLPRMGHRLRGSLPETGLGVNRRGRLS